jgi:cobalamin-dependent methionine synthase I
MRKSYEIHEVQPYINWDYFYYAWQLRTPDQQQQCRLEAGQVLAQLEGRYRSHALFELFEAHAEGDDIHLTCHPSPFTLNPEPFTLPLLRQQQGDCLCLSDFIHPGHDHIGVFATTVDMGLETDFDQDPYQKMMVQLLADRLAEATAERLHEEVRKEIWGYAPDEHLTMAELHAEKFQGIRPAVGYPSLPDTSLNFVLDKLLAFRQIGIRLTESGAMKPHASVSGLMIALPEAHYFSIGKIGEDQLHDYAHRRGLPVETLRKFLSTLLSNR